VPGPHEEPVDAPSGGEAVVRDAVHVDEETAVLVVSSLSGQQRLVIEPGLFFPEWHEDILEVRSLVRVAPHEVAVVRDNDGRFHFYSGETTAKEAAGGEMAEEKKAVSDDKTAAASGSARGDDGGTAFFLPPHCELVTMQWSSGTSADDVANNRVRNAKEVKYKVPVTKIDLRSQYAFFEYKVRTSDNVELLLEGTIFWQVVDVPRMIERTGDPKGDVWYHARSSLIQEVSRVTFEQFMASFSELVARAGAADAETFYAERGVRVHGLEVVRYECADERTAGVLQEIIEETTNRINRLQQQRSENEVARERVTAEIELEKQRTALVEARASNEMLEANAAGEADGARRAQSARAFLELLGDTVKTDEARLALLRFFSEQETLTKQTEHLATGNAQLFLTPQDVNLKLQAPAAGVGET